MRCLTSSCSKVLLDTGSADLLIPGNKCKTCTGHSLFHPSKSGTFLNKPNKRFNLPFATGVNAVPTKEGYNISGTLVTDSVEFGGLKVHQQGVLLADSYATQYKNMPMDGIFGMSPSKLSHLPNTSTPFLWTALKGAPFSFLLNSDATNPGVSGGELTLGGTDPSKYEGDISYISMNRSIPELEAFWVLDVPAFSINNWQSPIKSGLAVMDTGTAYINPPDYNSTAAIYARISKDIKQIDNAGAWGASCDIMSKLRPTLSFRLGSGDRELNLTIPQEAFNLGSYKHNRNVCQGVFVNPLNADGQPLWVIGSPFLKGYYTVWDGRKQAIGFGEVKNQNNATSTIPTRGMPTPTPPIAGSDAQMAFEMQMGLLSGALALAMVMLA